MNVILECIELHHTGKPGCSIESVLLRDADALDFLGPVGLFRIFSKQTKNLRKAFEIAGQKMKSCRDILELESSAAVAEDRITRMKDILAQFEKDSFGIF